MPIAPARCAITVSVVITRSRFAITAAASAKSRSPLHPSNTRRSSGTPRNSSSASPFCNETNRKPPNSRTSGSSVSSFVERSLSARYSRFPAHASPIRGPPGSSPSSAARSLARSASARRYGIGAGTVSTVVSETAGMLISGQCKSNPGNCSPCATTTPPSAFTSGSTSRTSGACTSSTISAPIAATFGKYRTNCTVSPSPCSAYTSSLRVPAGRFNSSSPFHRGSANLLGRGCTSRKRHRAS